MTMRGFKFGEVGRALVAAVPEIKPRYDKSAEWQAKVPLVGGSPTEYEVIESMLQPFLGQQLELNKDPALLKRIFDFFEQMATSSDPEVPNLLQVGIFENLVAYPARLAVAWKYMGEETKQIARDTARIFRRQHNLPRE